MRLFLLTSFLFFSFAALAQTGLVRGEVFDENGLLPGVDISVSKISTSISTDADGAFAIELKPGEYDFVFRFPEYNNESRVLTVNISEIEDIEVEMKLEKSKNENLEQDENTQLQVLEMLKTGQGFLIFMKQIVLRIK